jgi:hypothetical protein
MTDLTHRAGPVEELAVVAGVIGEPYAVAGRTLALLRGWLDVEPPRLPQFVVPASRRLCMPGVAAIRRIERWSELEVVRDDDGLMCLGVIDGVMSVAEYCDDGVLHAVVQDLAFRGALDVVALDRRRRQGIPGSARLARVCARYQIGLDSAQEYVVYRELSRRRLAPDHLNVRVRTDDGRTAGPFDGYSEVGAAYQVEGAVHFSEARTEADARRDARAEGVGVEVVKLIAPDVAAVTPMLEGWSAALAAAESRDAGARVTVLHLPGRGCRCGHQPR